MTPVTHLIQAAFTTATSSGTVSRPVLVGAVIVVFVGLAVWQVLDRRPSASTGYSRVARCRDGHLFMSTYTPGVSTRSGRLGSFRVQRCPVGNHLSVVRPVDATRLTAQEIEEAQAHRDSPWA